MTVIFILFGLAALGGIYLLSYILKDKKTPKGVALIHGSVGVFAVIFLLIASLYNHKLVYSLVLFILAAIGGVVLFIYDLYGKTIPKSFALAHGLMAIAGLAALALIF